MDGDARYPQDRFHAENVEQTVAELERAVQDHEAALSQLREGMVVPQFAGGAAGAKASLDVTARAYDAVAKSEPFLPFSRSVLPALLAMRKTHRTILESRSYLKAQGASLENARKRLEIEQANLADQKALQAELEKRVQSLRDALESGAVSTPDEALQSRIQELKQQNLDCKRDRKKLMVDLGKFIREHLGRQLALEQSGGPVVGDLMELDSDDPDSSRRQQPRKRKRRGQGQRDQSDSEDDEDQASAMAEELQELIENLLTAAAEQPQAYVAIREGSVPATFLVRSKVAQFHPQDAARLRLIDFGRDFED
ncbi:hypothetical protein GQ53DRAFT_167584 [Thozetella sp. PMI_491]|nr:hypothetical protein GQ53DRAFT_167584 [Thozetella sp. PMI_491]